VIVMVGRNPRYEIDIMIIQALEEEPQLGYIDLEDDHYITYVEKTLSLHKCCRFVKSIYIKSTYDQPVETIEESSEDKQT
jgi:hypothetical protein